METVFEKLTLPIRYSHTLHHRFRETPLPFFFFFFFFPFSLSSHASGYEFPAS